MNIKKVIASALMFTMTTIMVVNCFAKVDITKENLQNAYNELAKEYNGSYTSLKGVAGYMNRNATTPVKVEDNELVYEYEEFSEKVTKKIKYDLSGKPTFSIEKTIKKDTPISELYDGIGDEMELPMLGVVGCAIVQGVDDKAAAGFKEDIGATYKIRKYSSVFLMGDTLSVGNDSDNMKEFKNGEALELIDYAVNDNVEIKDELFDFYTYKFTKTKKSDTEYVLKAEAVVNLDANLSSVAGSSDSSSVTNEVNNAVDNKVNNVTPITITNTSNVTNTSNTSSIVNSTVNNTVNNTANNIVNNVVNKPTEVPKAGADTLVPNLIIIFSIVAVINGIKLRNLDRKND